MDIKSFIESGLLEAYLLGQCTAEERLLVERMVAEHAEVRAEMTIIEMALESYAAANTVSPPEWMKGRILERIETDNTTTPPPPIASKVPLRIFQVLAAVLALIAGFLFWQTNKLTSEKTTLEAQIAELQQQMNDCAERGLEMESLQQVNNLLRDRDTRAVPLANAEKGQLTGYAYLNAAQCEVAIDLNSLPAPPQGKYFQFWSIVDGKPVSMGMVDLQASNGWQLIACQQNAVALAISQEDNPNGNPTPTEVLMVGAIPAS